MTNRGFTSRLLALGAALALASCGTSNVGTGGPNLPDPDPAQQITRLTLLHNNDGESQLIDAGGANADFGGVARFKSLLDALRHAATTDASADDIITPVAVTVSSGDNFLAGPEFNASQNAGVYYDALALGAFEYDAIALGNHDFDFGPELLAEFIAATPGTAPFVSSNLDFSGEPALQAHVTAGRLRPSVLVEKAGVKIGIVGATTEELPLISSPRNVQVGTVAAAIQQQVDALTAQGATIVIVVSHLQSIENEKTLAGQLRGVDIIVAGGGGELLANAADALVPGDEEIVSDAYPVVMPDADGNDVPIVTTPGDYKYLGRLVVDFDEAGVLLAIDNTKTGPVRVAGGAAPDAVEPDAGLQASVVVPVQQSVEALGASLVATSEVALNGNRNPGIRTQETNLGNLCADALLWQAQQSAASFGADLPTVALQNGGGIRNNSLLPAGSLSELDTFSILPFANFVCVVEDVSAANLRDIMEQAVSNVENAGGAFGHFAGLCFFYDPARPARQITPDGTQTQAGQRIREAWLADGTPLVADGMLVAGAPSVDVATIDFSARGGDGFPFDSAKMVVLGASYQQALENYLKDELGGAITAAQYPEGGSSRITTPYSGDLEFTHLASYSTGLGEASAEISAYDSKTQRLFVINTDAGSLDVVDVSDPADPQRIERLTLSAGKLNSVAAFDGVVAAAADADPKTDPGSVVFVDAATLDELGNVAVGSLPDMVCFTPDGNKVLVANEGEPATDYLIDPEGSISIIDVSGGFASPPVATAGFGSFDSQRAALRTAGIRIFGVFNGGESSVAQDLEPEYITLSADGKTAWVSCQENNALAVIDVPSATVTDLVPLGDKDHSLPGNSLDPSDRDNGAHLGTWPLKGMYMPDTLASYTVGGQTYILSANEGDAREYDAFAEEERIKDLTLDPTAFPDAAALQEDAAIGRLNSTTASGDTDGDGDHDVLYCFGGRSFSIWDAGGAQVYDSGNAFETYFAANLPDYFNGEVDLGVPEFTTDDRSDNKGPEPEGAAVGFYKGRWLGFIGLERQGGYFAYDVTDPAAPLRLGAYASTDYAAATGDFAPEGFTYVPAWKSPVFKPLLFVSHEVSGTVAIWQLGESG